ncbi:MAG: hypothetical protein QM754_00535 [Tepidisphaeraceae bacterium]
MKLVRPACLSLLLAAIAAAAGDASDPQLLAEQVRRLDDRDPHVRDAARTALMGLKVDDAAYLKRAIVAAGPVRPHRAELLREVMTYVYTRQAIAQIPRKNNGFLGVTFDRGVLFEPDDAPPGQIVSGLVPGFVGARYLAAGDILLGFTFDGRTEWVGRTQLVVDIIGKLPAGKSVDVLVSRDGQSLTIPITLDGRPDDTPVENGPADLNTLGWDGRMAKFADDAEAAAEQEVAREFGRLVGEG